MAIKGVNKPSNTDIYVFFSVFFHFTKISGPDIYIIWTLWNRGVRLSKNCRSRQSPKATFNIRLNKVRGLKGLLKASYTAVYSTLFS